MDIRSPTRIHTAAIAIARTAIVGERPSVPQAREPPIELVEVEGELSPDARTILGISPKLAHLRLPQVPTVML